MNLPKLPFGINYHFDKHGEINIGHGQIIDLPVIMVENPGYIIEINGKNYKAVVLDDSGMSHIPARLDYDETDMRQMEIFILGGNLKIKSYVYLSYYKLRSGKLKVIFLLARSK